MADHGTSDTVLDTKTESSTSRSFAPPAAAALRTTVLPRLEPTGVIFAAMATIATVSKRDFSGLGKVLFMGVIVILLAAFANIFLQLPALMMTISVLAIVIFSAYMLFDVQRVVNGGETNYISATLAIYLDLYNVFTNLLALLGIFGGNRN